MNLKFLPALSIFFFFALPLFSQTSLEVRITNIKKPVGYMMLALFDSGETFLGTEYFRAIREPVGQTDDFRMVLEDLPYGRYAISIFHDKNSNEELDTNFVGIPNEPYGFSNNARGFMGPPDFESAAFEYQEGKNVIEIRLR